MFRRIVSGVTLGAAVCAVLGLVDGCLTRPVAATNPVTKTNFITQIQQGSIDKVDLLFDIDNSASMGDKQNYLSEAVPDLIKRLVQPNCVQANMNITGQAHLDGTCDDATSTAEFPPVHNLHIGIVSSSLGARLGDVCPTTGDQAAQPLDSTTVCTGPGQPTAQCLDRHNDDQAHLLNRGGTLPPNYQETVVGDATGKTSADNFLNWFPPVTTNQNATSTGPTGVTDPGVLQGDFQTMVIGVHQFGCGIESQLETWYRFLIQPDPYASLMTDTSGRAQWVGIDTTLLAQRADFLRPDSLVAILVLTDENDSEVDVRSFGGSAWQFMKNGFNPPRGTAACSNPASPDCQSCYDSTAGVCATRYTSRTDWGFDLNLRHVHEKQKYGASVQFPIQRYVVGLTSSKVPNRDGEYPPADPTKTEGTGAYASSYQGLVAANQTCTNPLYAATLPKPPTNSTAWTKDLAASLCNLSVGPRKPNLVFYAHIGGVPHELLQNDPNNKTDVNAQSQKDTLMDSDWKLILGNDPENFDYSGIDPHMIESFKSRVAANASLPQGAFKVSDSSMPTGSDPIAGKEWTTDSTMPLHTGLTVDREYACIFKLATTRHCDNASTTADPTLQDSCDCQPPATGVFSKDEVPAVCNDTDPSKYTEQDSAKAYPTIRELEVAHLLGQIQGANEGIISSLCPIHTADNSTGDDPLYGYRPAMNAIITRLKQALSHTCLPQQLDVDPATSQVQCLVLVTFPKNTPPNGNCEDPSLNGAYKTPDPTVLQHFNNDQHAQWLASQTPGVTPPDDPSTLTTCSLKQLPARMDCSVKSAMNQLGWCYVDEGMVQGCPQAILFAPGAVTGSATTSLQCIEASNSVVGDAASPLGTIGTADDAAASGD
jgi:hypothetical protein